MRVRILAEHLRYTAASLGKEVGVSSSSAALYWTGKRPWPTESLPALADRLHTTVDYLFGRTDDPGVLEFRGSPAQFDDMVDMVGAARDRREKFESASRDDDLVDIASIDFAYGFGGAYLDVGDPNVDTVKFSPSWLRARGILAPPEFIGVAQGIGDSMEPMFSDRDMIFFDRSARLEDHMGDKVWVFAYGQVGMVKILRPLPDGTIKIISANRMYPDEIAQAEELFIIGRVVSSWRNH